MAEIIINAETMLAVNNSIDKRFRLIDNIQDYKIIAIVFDYNVFKLILQDKATGQEVKLLIEGTVNYGCESVDLNNLQNIRLTFSSSGAIYYSNKENKNLFELMIWDMNNKAHPNIVFIAEKIIFFGEESKLNLRPIGD